MPPKVVGPYRILGTLGRGGVGTVYRAEERTSGDIVAVKLLSTGSALEPAVARRLVREFEALEELSHPNVVRVFAAGVHQGYPYLVMELVDGLDLRTWLATDLGGAILEPAIALRRGDESDEGDEVDEGEGEREASLTGAPRFGVDELFEEADSGEFGSISEERPRDDDDDEPSSDGGDELRAWANLADEPDTLETRSLTMSEELPVRSRVEKGTRAQKPARPRPTRAQLDALNREERVGRLKDAMLQLCDALGYIHSHGLVHRDVKPGNVLVDEDRRVRLMDFGLAKHLAEDVSVTAHGRVVGTYRYMAPEQAMGERVDGRADLYSLGVMLYELLAGVPPYDADTPIDLWQKVLETEPEPLWELNPDVDETLARVAHRLLRKDPEERFQTAEEIFELVVSG